MLPNKLAIINSLFKLPESAPHGTNHAGFTSSDAIMRFGQFDEVDVFVEEPQNVSFGVSESGMMPFPKGVHARLRHISELCYCNNQYMALYCAGPAWIQAVPFALRPLNDPSPVISEIDFSHGRLLWNNLLLGMVTGGIRPTDGFIFKAEATRRIYENVWAHWKDEGYIATGPPKSLVSPNPIDVTINQRDEDLRKRIRDLLGIGREQVVFLAFNRLEPSTKGDLPSLIASWTRVLEMSPNAVLVLAGAMTYHSALYVEQLKSFARLAGVSKNLIILPNPFDLFADARNALMSGSDVFLHVSLGIEESAPLTILEAMAHQLPPVVASWSGMIEQVVNGESGFVVPTRYIMAPAMQSQLFWGRDPLLANRDAATFACIEPQEFVNIVNALAQNPTLRQTIGLNAFQQVQIRFNIERIARDRVQFIRETATEARRSTVEKEQTVLVSIDRITKSLVCGLELSPMDIVCRGQLIDYTCLSLWVNERLLSLATSMISKLEGSKPKSLGDLLTAVLEASGQTVEAPITEMWSSEFGKHFQWISLRLIAAGFWTLSNPK